MVPIVLTLVSIVFSHIIIQYNCKYFVENSRRKEVTKEVSIQVYQSLLARSKNGTRLGKYDTREVDAQFGLHMRTVQRLWKGGKTQFAQGIPVNVASRKKGKSR
ncbi:hypothetical protein PR202_gb24586 [Eleusine coracana subsp. coracana]|uniref:DUF7769 domain-containing protein n=1 Tax=Eleusine coracana subsp. coracana TaxID=191504 RepID=A0AAV5FLU4_ELECO|nr:hypothetical protein PR202_gb24586 [Eleusine coracana subsp. coracana]